MKVKVNGVYVAGRCKKAVTVIGLSCFVLIFLASISIFLMPSLVAATLIVVVFAISLGALSIVVSLFKKK